MHPSFKHLQSSFSRKTQASILHDANVKPPMPDDDSEADELLHHAHSNSGRASRKTLVSTTHIPKAFPHALPSAPPLPRLHCMVAENQTSTGGSRWMDHSNDCPTEMPKNSAFPVNTLNNGSIQNSGLAYDVGMNRKPVNFKVAERSSAFHNHFCHDGIGLLKTSLGSTSSTDNHFPSQNATRLFSPSLEAPLANHLTDAKRFNNYRNEMQALSGWSSSNSLAPIPVELTKNEPITMSIPTRQNPGIEHGELCSEDKVQRRGSQLSDGEIRECHPRIGNGSMNRDDQLMHGEEIDIHDQLRDERIFAHKAQLSDGEVSDGEMHSAETKSLAESVEVMPSSNPRLNITSSGTDKNEVEECGQDMIENGRDDAIMRDRGAQSPKVSSMTGIDRYSPDARPPHANTPEALTSNRECESYNNCMNDKNIEYEVTIENERNDQSIPPNGEWWFANMRKVGEEDESGILDWDALTYYPSEQSRFREDSDEDVVHEQEPVRERM